VIQTGGVEGLDVPMNDQETHESTSLNRGSGCRNVGIIADSHGRPHTISAAIGFLRQRGCGRIYHLGDVCDSFLPETSGSCVRILEEASVSTVKGNNDHAIVINNMGQRQTPVSDRTLAYLHDLPYVVEDGEAVFTHSLPFVGELGLSSMIGVLREAWVRRFFSEFPRGILFRGHGHTPRIRWIDSNGGHLICEAIPTGQPIDLAGRIPCVVTCGALTDGLCMVWDTVEGILTCLSLG